MCRVCVVNILALPLVTFPLLDRSILHVPCTFKCIAYGVCVCACVRACVCACVCACVSMRQNFPHAGISRSSRNQSAGSAPLVRSGSSSLYSSTVVVW